MEASVQNSRWLMLSPVLHYLNCFEFINQSNDNKKLLFFLKYILTKVIQPFLSLLYYAFFSVGT